MTIQQHLATLLIPVIPNYYYGGAPQGLTPVNNRLVYMVATQIDREYFVSQSQVISQLKEWDFQFSSWATEYSDARAYADAVTSALVGLKEWPSGITACWLKGEKDLPFSDDAKLYGIATMITLQENL